MDSESESTQKVKSEQPGQTFTKPQPKECKHCGAPARVLRDKKTKSGWTTNNICNDCSWLWTQYRIRKPEYEAMLAQQNNQCAICGSKGGTSKHLKLAVDHCHETGKVRGLLCMPCNTAIGKLPTVDHLKSAINYLSTNV